MVMGCNEHSLYIYDVVNFLSQETCTFLLFQLHYHTLPYPKTKEKQKLPEIKKNKITTTYLSFEYSLQSLRSLYYFVVNTMDTR